MCRQLHEAASLALEDETYKEEKIKDVKNAAKNYHKDFLKDHRDLASSDGGTEYD